VPVVTHLVSLRQPAGVEAHFAEFITYARAFAPGYRHGWLDAAGGMHPFVAKRVANELEHVIDAKHGFGIRLPAWPVALRRWHCRRSFASYGTDVLIVWNRTAKAAFAVDALGAERCIHWEHGAAWDAGREEERGEYLRRIPLALANSTAAARVLRLRWGYRGELHVCRNALRPSLVPQAPVRGRRLRDPVRLGVAARLYAVKGVALAVQALARVRQSGLAAELAVAGEGPERPRLEALAAALGVAPHVRFLGAVSDMASFYANIDCLVHAPITEAFGLVALEAAAHGCPVIAARVDGLPEAVADGISGRCIAPTLAIEDYVELGGALAGLPAVVYDPDSDLLTVPRAVAPESLAAAVQELCSDRERYSMASERASAHVLSGPDFAVHVRDVMTVIHGFVERPR
jgi:glycosyltransferase involved in cell wall biosynthesis